MTAQRHAVGAAGVTQAAATAASRPRSSPATLVANFELLAEADGGASRLRMLIRDLAVRGLLTEPVSTGPSAVDDGLDVSLEAFTSPHVTEQEDLLAAAALPANNWIRTKLGNVVVLSYGKSLPKKARNAYGKIPTYGSNGAVGFHDESLIHEPCLVIGRKGSSGAVNVTNGPSWPIDTAYFVVPPKGLTLQFLFILLRAIRLDRFDRSTAIPGLNRTDAYALTVLLPPLAEQKRIVAKVDQLMALCDELEARQTKKRETGSRLTKSALEALTTAETPEDFNRAGGIKVVVGQFELMPRVGQCLHARPA